MLTPGDRQVADSLTLTIAAVGNEARERRPAAAHDLLAEGFAVCERPSHPVLHINSLAPHLYVKIWLIWSTAVLPSWDRPLYEPSFLICWREFMRSWSQLWEKGGKKGEAVEVVSACGVLGGPCMRGRVCARGARGKRTERAGRVEVVGRWRAREAPSLPQARNASRRAALSLTKLTCTWPTPWRSRSTSRGARLKERSEREWMRGSAREKEKASPVPPPCGQSAAQFTQYQRLCICSLVLGGSIGVWRRERAAQRGGVWARVFTAARQLTSSVRGVDGVALRVPRAAVVSVIRNLDGSRDGQEQGEEGEEAEHGLDEGGDGGKKEKENEQRSRKAGPRHSFIQASAVPRRHVPSPRHAYTN